MLSPDALEELVRTGETIAPDGSRRPAQAQIRPDQAEALQRHVRELGPDRSLEIGLAHGVSAMAILGAGRGHLTSLDPLQFELFDGLGLHALERTGLVGRHTFVEAYDYIGLPRLLEGGERVQFAYIDGWHTFDYALLDFFYADKMLDVGGTVAFNDCAMPAVHRVLGFVTSHRAYEEVDVGLPRVFTGTSKADTLRRRLQGRVHADRYFRKLRDGEPGWDFHARF